MYNDDWHLFEYQNYLCLFRSNLPLRSLDLFIIIPKRTRHKYEKFCIKMNTINAVKKKIQDRGLEGEHFISNSLSIEKLSNT